MVLVLAVATAALLTMDRGPGIPAAMRHKSATTQPQASGDLRQLVLGTWQDDYQGKRTLTVRPDGTATMLVEFDGWKA
jgi:hypothetical protein